MNTGGDSRTTIRPAASNDYDALCALFDEVDALHRERVPEIFRRPAGPVRERTYIEGLLTDDSVALFLALVGDRPAGAVVVLLHDAPPIPLLVPRRIAVVDNLIVGASFRRSGVGGALMRAAETWAVEHGAAAVELNVFEFNAPAVAFYESLGYTPLTRRMSKPVSRRCSEMP